jgi:cellulose synthase/poly-beta-1,6-N-acetylglucosamine synthase-like glycosyltransferase
VLLTLFLVCATALLLSTALLLAFGHRVRVARRWLGILLAVLVALVAGETVRIGWNIEPRLVHAGEALTIAAALLVVLARSDWNPFGQVFFGSFVLSALVYLVFALYVTFGSGLPALGMVASFLLFLLELAALTLSVSFAFESLDVATRARWRRETPDPDPTCRPFVSLQIASYNEPPDMLIRTIASVESIDYPDFEVVVIDNNTRDPAVWQPVADYCEGRERVTFVHVDDWPGYKAGALNLVLREYTDPRAEIVGVIDADYLVDPSYLESVVVYFADPSVAYVQTPQDYREWEGDPYLTACYDAYRYFFTTTMPSRNERDSIIFAGTMGLLRRGVLEELGGWNEWCITEDAETSLRILLRGYSGVYVAQSFGRGVMPLTFGSFKSQRFRWCFGGMQILRMHWRDLKPWNRDPSNHLTLAQRLDYILGGVQWLNDLVYLGFTAVLLASAVALIRNGSVAIRPLVGAATVLPAALIVSGLVRAMWTLRVQTGIGARRAALAFANWLSVSWTVAIACVQGLVRRRGVFMRTPKIAERRDAVSALWTARTETLLVGLLWGAAALTVVHGVASALLVALFAWQGSVYATAPFMSLLSTRTALTPELERRRRTEWMRERLGRAAPYLVGAAAALAVVGAFAAIIGFGGSQPGTQRANPFEVQHATPAVSTPSVAPSLSPSATSTPSVSPPASVSPSATVAPSPSVTTSPSVSPSGAPSTATASSSPAP